MLDVNYNFVALHSCGINSKDSYGLNFEWKSYISQIQARMSAKFVVVFCGWFLLIIRAFCLAISNLILFMQL